MVEGDFVPFWTETTGHCDIVKKIDLEKMKWYCTRLFHLTTAMEFKSLTFQAITILFA